MLRRTHDEARAVGPGLVVDSAVARGGVEPPTFRFSVGRSYQLSYLAVAVPVRDSRGIVAHGRGGPEIGRDASAGAQDGVEGVGEQVAQRRARGAHHGGVATRAATARPRRAPSGPRAPVGRPPRAAGRRATGRAGRRRRRARRRRRRTGSPARRPRRRGTTPASSTAATAAGRPRRARRAAACHGVAVRPTAAGSPAWRRIQSRPATCSRQPARAAAALRAVDRDGEVAELAAEAARAAVQRAVEHDAGADTDVAVDEHEAVGAAVVAGPQLAERREVGLVVEPDRARARYAVDAARSRSTTATSVQPRFGASAAPAARRGRRARARPRRRRRTGRPSASAASSAASTSAAAAAQHGGRGPVPLVAGPGAPPAHVAGEVDDDRRESVDVDLEPDPRAAGGVQREVGARAPDAAVERVPCSHHEAGGEQLVDDAADRRAGEPGGCGDLGPGERAVGGDLVEDERAVEAAYVGLVGRTWSRRTRASTRPPPGEYVWALNEY